ncbi:MAG: TIGR00300 family protein [Bdellovibrionota bacterium]
MSSSYRLLMCSPTHYDVQYVINPWMEGNINKMARETAAEQWKQLYNVLSSIASVELIEQQSGLPDMVFTANAGLVLENAAVLSRFYHPERQGEEQFFREWFAKHGFSVHELPLDLPFEGAGDALFDRGNSVLWAGYGFRTELDSHARLAEWLSVEVLSLHLVDDRFYHLDTCFCPLEGGYLMYYPPAFDQFSNRLIELRVPDEKRIVVSEIDALNFACNAVNLGKTVVMNSASPALKERLAAAGFSCIETPLGEFLKGGGSSKCLTLRLDEPKRTEAQAVATFDSQVVCFEGHLLDSGLISTALDVVIDGGGSFQILKFQLGEQRQSLSTAEIKIIAPSSQVMESLLAQLIGLGAKLRSDEEQDAQTRPVEQDGVAPDDFHVTTSFPTEVRIAGNWTRVERQRADAMVVISGSEAKCKALRDLKSGDAVVIGLQGIRTAHPTRSREQRSNPNLVLGSAWASSERRLELLVEQIAWEVRRISDRSGKVVVCAGAVVVHTGGSIHLAQLVRDGYVQGLLAGNAFAVFEMEQSLLGTSQGIDLKRGVPVPGGHRHPLKAINIIRRAGGMKSAVEQGLLTQGIFHECISSRVPFCVSGSIGDEGPLPETITDTLVAQNEYERILADADLLLLLSATPQALAVGGMASVDTKVVCVDLNPSVSAQLQDHGKPQTIGVATDVGVFLNLLVQQLERMTKPGGSV